MRRRRPTQTRGQWQAGRTCPSAIRHRSARPRESTRSSNGPCAARGFVGDARKDKTVRPREVRYNLSFVIRSFRDHVTVKAQATMPIYEYRCAACGHEIEALQKLSDAPLTVCPSCQKPELKKLLSAAGFQLKGSGWYATDFRNSGAKPAAKEKAAAKATASGDNG